MDTAWSFGARHKQCSQCGLLSYSTVKSRRLCNWINLDRSLAYYPKDWWILLVSENYVREKDCRCCVTETVACVLLLKGSWQQEFSAANLFRKIWWQTAASCKWRTTSHSTLHNSGTEEFQIRLWNYLTSQTKDSPSIMPTSLNVKKPWLSFWVLIML